MNTTTNISNVEDLPLALCVEDVMAVLGIGRATAYALLRAGRIRSVRVGRKIRVPRSALQDFLDGKE